jgi:predicted acylesterase/phospholipase RssA
MPPVRLSLVLSGGASLGAYQAGAMAAVVQAVQATRAQGVDLAVDSLGGASAGAIVSFLGAHALLDGRDPVRLLHDTWVHQVDLDVLLGDRDAPLGFDELRKRVGHVLAPFDDEEPRTPQAEPLVLHAALTNLRGLRYELAAHHRDGVVQATTFVDWSRFVLQPEGGREQLTTPVGRSPLDLVFASAANPGGFAPVALDRSDDADGYRARGIRDFPDTGTLWYSDGGLLQSQPVGRVIGAGRQVAPGDEQRMVLLVDPRSEDPTDRFADPAAQLTWIEGLGRSLAIVSAQALYDDLRRLEKDNSRLRWVDDLAGTLADHLDDDGRRALAEVLERIDADREGVGSDEPHRERHRDTGDAAGVLRAVVEEVAGLGGKRPVLADVISPLALVDDEDVPAVLAGEMVGDFGGFLDASLRHSDFLLGYDSAAAWLDRSWDALALPDGTHDVAREAVARARVAPWTDANRGGADVRDLPWSSRLAMARFAGHVMAAVADTLLPPRLARAVGAARTAVGATGSTVGHLRDRALGRRSGT